MTIKADDSIIVCARNEDDISQLDVCCVFKGISFLFPFSFGDGR